MRLYGALQAVLLMEWAHGLRSVALYAQILVTWGGWFARYYNVKNAGLDYTISTAEFSSAYVSVSVGFIFCLVFPALEFILFAMGFSFGSPADHLFSICMHLLGTFIFGLFWLQHWTYWGIWILWVIFWSVILFGHHMTSRHKRRASGRGNRDDRSQPRPTGGAARNPARSAIDAVRHLSSFCSQSRLDS